MRKRVSHRIETSKENGLGVIDVVVSRRKSLFELEILRRLSRQVKLSMGASRADKLRLLIVAMIK